MGKHVQRQMLCYVKIVQMMLGLLQVGTSGIYSLIDPRSSFALALMMR